MSDYYDNEIDKIIEQRIEASRKKIAIFSYIVVLGLMALVSIIFFLQYPKLVEAQRVERQIEHPLLVESDDTWTLRQLWFTGDLRIEDPAQVYETTIKKRVG